MCEKLEVWANHICNGHLDQSTVWTALNWIILKSLVYLLPATCLSQKECQHIMAPLPSAVLPVLGMNQHFPHDIIYGPKCYGGLAIPNLFLTQGVDHVEQLHTYGV